MTQPTTTPENVRSVLTELLRLYDWRNEIGRIERDFNHDHKQVKTWLNQYGREKKAAWEAAVRVLSAPSSTAPMTGETPRTDALAAQWPDRRWQEHARQLERELAEAKKMCELADIAVRYPMSANTLKQALEAIASGELGINLCIKVAKKALAPADETGEKRG